MTPLQQLMHEAVCGPSGLTACLCGAYARVGEEWAKKTRKALKGLHDISWHIAEEISVTPGFDPVADQHMADWRKALDESAAALAPDSAPEGT